MEKSQSVQDKTCSVCHGEMSEAYRDLGICSAWCFTLRRVLPHVYSFGESAKLIAEDNERSGYRGCMAEVDRDRYEFNMSDEALVGVGGEEVPWSDYS